MRLSTLDPTTFSDETLIPLEISGCAPAHPETGAVTFEQSMHLNGRHPDSPVRPGWLGLLLDLDPQSDLEQVSAAAIRVLNRHHELRVCYRPSEQGWQRWVLDEVQVGVGEPTQLGSTQPERVARLQELIDEQANAWTPAGIHLSVLEPSHRLLLGADHTHVDAISMAVIARDLLAALGQLDEELDEIESFGSATDRHALRDGKVDPASIARWHSFFDLAGGLPSLPVDLGLAPGETAPRAMIVEHLLDPQEMAAWSTQAKERGSGLAALALAAITLAIDEVSTEARRPLPVVLPMHTRDQPQAMRSVGWYVRNAPLVVPSAAPTRVCSTWLSGLLRSCRRRSAMAGPR